MAHRGVCCALVLLLASLACTEASLMIHIRRMAREVGSTHPLLARLLQAAQCSTGTVPCGSNCIPADSVCCEDTGNFCPVGTTCVKGSDKCASTCGSDEQQCGLDCIPLDAECCGQFGEDTIYCFVGSTCTKDNPPKCVEKTLAPPPKSPAPPSLYAGYGGYGYGGYGYGGYGAYGSYGNYGTYPSK